MLQKLTLNLSLILSLTLIQSLILFSLKLSIPGVWAQPVGLPLTRTGEDEADSSPSAGQGENISPENQPSGSENLNSPLPASTSSTTPAQNPPATRQRPSKYVPPSTDARPQRLISGGSRGCNQPGNSSLTLLVPPSHLPLTISRHPTFLFHLDNLPRHSLLFTLVEPGMIEPIWETKLTLTQPGLVTLKLPPDTLGLEVGQEYYWTVAILCNEKRPSQNAYARAAIKRIPPPAKITDQLISNPDNREKAQIYAQSGFWYDAIASSYQDYLQDVPSRQLDAYFWQLLAQVGLQNIRSPLIHRQ